MATLPDVPVTDPDGDLEPPAVRIAHLVLVVAIILLGAWLVWYLP